MKIFLIILLAILCMLPIFMGIYLIVYHLFYRKYFSRKGGFFKYENKRFLSSLNKEKGLEEFTEIKLQNDVLLRGRYKTKGKNKLAILMHSFGCDNRQMEGLGEFFLQEGFDVFMPDLRGHGKSEGTCSYGLKEGEDLKGWIDKLKEKNPEYKFVIYGVGLGCAGILNSINDLKDVLLVFCESGFDDPQKEISFIMSREKLTPPQKSFLNYLKRSENLNFQKNIYIENVKNSQIPIFIIHSDKDEIVPIEMAYSLYDNISNLGKELLILQDSMHGDGAKKQPFKLRLFISKNIRKYNI